jgi:type IV secretory pathway VirB10-like protein
MNFNNMNRYGTSAGTTEGTFGAAEGTFGGDCNRNKLGQLLVANIAALLNKKSESESESEKIVAIPNTPKKLKVVSTPPALPAPRQSVLEEEEEKRLLQIQQTEDKRREQLYQKNQQFQQRVREETMRQQEKQVLKARLINIASSLNLEDLRDSVIIPDDATADDIIEAAQPLARALDL